MAIPVLSPLTGPAVSGEGLLIQTTDGSGVATHIAVFDPNGTLIDGGPVPSGGSGTQVNADWDATSGVAQILNQPVLATVATSGSYNDLSNKPVTSGCSMAMALALSIAF